VNQPNLAGQQVISESPPETSPMRSRSQSPKIVDIPGKMFRDRLRGMNLEFRVPPMSFSFVPRNVLRHQMQNLGTQPTASSYDLVRIKNNRNFPGPSSESVVHHNRMPAQSLRARILMADLRSEIRARARNLKIVHGDVGEEPPVPAFQDTSGQAAIFERNRNTSLRRCQ
jgi:hypothetical protein